jgi:membrane fusion protein, heavy metal efflux system
MMSYKFIRTIAALCLLTGSFQSCDEPAGENKKTDEHAAPGSTEMVTLTETQMMNAGIETAVPVRQQLNTELAVNGSIDVPPQNIVSISFPFGGYLKNTKLLPGMHVSKGEVIGLMEDQSLVQLQQDYLVAVAKMKYLQLEYDRQKMLQENNVNSAKTFQQVESEFSSQKVQVSGLGQKLKMIHINPQSLNEQNISSTVPIYSPINGFVSRVNVNIGKFVNPTDVLFELINPTDLHAALVVFEKDIAKVQKGQKVKVSLVDEPNREYLCEVILVTRNVSEDRTGIVHCHFEQMPQALLPGMFLNATILISGIRGLTVPEEAVVRYGSKEYVLQEQSKTDFKLVQVTTGVRQKGQIQLIDSADHLSSKRVIIKNAYAVLSKLKNKID